MGETRQGDGRRWGGPLRPPLARARPPAGAQEMVALVPRGGGHRGGAEVRLREEDGEGRGGCGDGGRPAPAVSGRAEGTDGFGEARRFRSEA